MDHKTNLMFSVRNTKLSTLCGLRRVLFVRNDIPPQLKTCSERILDTHTERRFLAQCGIRG